MKPKLPGQMIRQQYFLLGGLGLMILIFQLVFFYKSDSGEKPPEVVFQTAQPAADVPILAEFDPNDLDLKQWQQLGLSEKQAQSVLNYKNSVGGTFTSKQQLKKAYALGNGKFETLERYILLPEESGKSFTNYRPKNYSKRKELNIPGRFNPDHFSAADWVSMGFTANQANAILKYKNYLGGSFISKERFRQCFIISAENYQKLEPYLMLPQSAPSPVQSFSNVEKKAENRPQLKPFDPNALDSEGWQQLGFSARQAESILKYKNTILKGRFRSVDDLARSYIIHNRIEELRPYIRLAEETATVTASFAKNEVKVNTASNIDFSALDLNEMTFSQLKEFGFSDRSAAGIIGFRKSLGGFVNKNQVFETYGIDREIAEKLAQTVRLNTSSVEKYSLSDAPESWLRTHPYFRYSADKIIFYRISNPDDKKIWKFLKTKPEYESKMRLYLKN